MSLPVKATAAALLALVGAQLSAAASAQDTTQSDIYVLAGQSNMSGRGALADLTVAERVADPRVRLYGNDGRWRAALDPLDDATNQVDPASADRQAAVGPGLPFARAMLRKRKHPIALVPCAKGGSAIASWTPAPDRNTLYGSCVQRTRQAGGHLAGLLWYQGESDAEKASAETWGTRFAALVGALRKDLDSPGLPIVFVQIADRPETNAARYANWAIVQDRQAQVSLPCTAMVSTKGLPRNPDDLHLTTAAHRILGPRLAEAMAALIRKGCR